MTGIVAVCTGPELHFARGSRSGIHRTPVPGRVAARVLGLDDRRGALAPGYDADLIALGPGLRVDLT
ncbi:MAG: amidohydrolase family protein, partial [Comamonas sp.]|nr:amidohydrolase family protein [Comamonas sp.]